MPNKPIIITLGNNDGPHHDCGPFQFEKEQFYTDLWKMWFEDHPGNRKFATAENKKHFMDGGYFRFDINDKLSVLSINTMESNID